MLEYTKRERVRVPTMSGARDVCADHGGGGDVTKGREGVHPCSCRKKPKNQPCAFESETPPIRIISVPRRGVAVAQRRGTLTPYVSNNLYLCKKKDYDED